MKIVVAYKWAPNPQDAGVAADGRVDWSRAKATVSQDDPAAIELGRRLADATGGELIGVSVGAKDVAAPMAKKAALSRGLDRIVLVADEALSHADPVTTALVLAEVVKKIGSVDVVLAGDSSIDGGAQLVPATLAGALGWPALAQVTQVTGTAGDLTIERSYRGGSQVLTASGPVVLSAAADAVTPRVPGMKDILAAGKKPSEEVALGSLAVRGLASGVHVTATSKPNLKNRLGQIIDGVDAATAATQLVAALRASNIL